MPKQTYQQVRDVVARIQTAHQQLRDILEATRPRTWDSRTRQMLDALRHDEQQQQIALARHLADGANPPLDTWLQYLPDEEVMQTLESIRFTPEMSAEEAVAVKQEFDQALRVLLRQLAEETAIPRVQEFFASLLDEIETRTSRASWNLREFQGEEEPPGSGD